MRFDLRLPGREDPMRVRLAQPGRHNVLNALGAAAVACEIGMSPEAIVRGLEQFGGIGRRFAEIGALDVDGRRILAFEDYGHHPTELDAVIQAAREGWPERRVVLFFQPHRFTRTRDQFDEFARVLSGADSLVLADIYPAGETSLAGIDSDSLARAVCRRRALPLRRVGAVADAVDVLPELLEDGDLLLVMGAGDVGQLGAQLTERYAAEAA
jgi:UDP-N-acetylmuramate--alanine ligase